MYTLVLLAGGKSTRMKNIVPKQFLLLAGKPIIMHTLETVEKIEKIKEIIIVSQKKDIPKLNKYIEDYRLRKKINFAIAGETRQASVYSGLQFVKTEEVIIHEAARPFVNKNEFEKLIKSKVNNATYVYPIPFTVLKSNNQKITGILNRNELVNIQLPQKFETKILLESHKKAIEERKEFTEDASLLYYYTNTEIQTIIGTSYNLKITEPVDLKLAEILYKENLLREEE